MKKKNTNRGIVLYYMTKIEDTVRIPPYRFDDPLEEVAIQTFK